MKRTVLILVGWLALAGCAGKPGDGRDRPIAPAGEQTPTMPASPVADRPAADPPGNAKRSAAATQPAASTGPNPYQVVVGPRVVAAAMLQVNDKFITLRQVLHPIRRQLQAAAAGLSEEAFRAKALELIRGEIRAQIERAVLLAEAEKQLSEEERAAVEEEAGKQLRLAAAEAGSRVLFDQRLAAEGTDLAAWQEDLRRALTVELFLHRRFGDRIVVTRRAMWEYYQAHRDEFRSGEAVQMQVIAAPFRKFLPEDGPASEEDRSAARRQARQQIDRAAAELAAGRNFAEVAAQLSKGPRADAGGTWPMMEHGSFRDKPVEDAAFAQQAGQISQVVETPLGFYIVKTLDRRPGREPTFQAVQGEIEQRLRRQQYDTLREDYIRELQGKTTISLCEQFEAVAVDAAVRSYFRPGASARTE